MKSKRDKVYVLSCFSKNIFVELVANSRNQAREFFEFKFKEKPNAIAGPYKRAKEYKMIAPTKMSKVKTSKYKGWNVKFIELNNESVLVIFDSKYDVNAIEKPKKPLIVKLKDLEI